MSEEKFTVVKGLNPFEDITLMMDNLPQASTSCDDSEFKNDDQTPEEEPPKQSIKAFYVRNIGASASNESDMIGCSLLKNGKLANPPEKCQIMSFMDVGNVHVFENTLRRMSRRYSQRRLGAKVMLCMDDIYDLIQPCCFPAAFSTIWKRRSVPSITEKS